MDKRSATVSARIPSELERQLQAVAAVRGVTLSDLVFHCLDALVEEERDRYLKLRSAFEGAPDKPGKSVEIGSGFSSDTESHHG